MKETERFIIKESTEEKMIPIYNSKKSISLKLLVFHAVFLVTFTSLLKIEWLRESIPLAILVIPLIAYLILLFLEAKSRINIHRNYDYVLSGCFWFSFWVGASLTLPMFIFRVGPDGPFRYQDLPKGFIIGYPLVSALMGLLTGLVGTVLINQFYGVLGGNKGTPEGAVLETRQN